MGSDDEDKELSEEDSVKSEGEEKSEEEDDDDDDEEEEEDDEEDDESLPVEQKFLKTKKKLEAAQQKMRTLVKNIGDYKQFLEDDRHVLEQQHKQEKKGLEDRNVELDKEVESLKEQYDQTVEEFESKIEQMEEEKKGKARENIENLQTLVKELTYIEELNEQLNAELEKHRDDNAQLQDELKISKQIIEQMEIRIAKQESVKAIAVTPSPAASKPASEVEAQLKEQLAKLKTVESLVSQLRLVVGGGSGEDASMFTQLKKEEVTHIQTKKQLEEEIERGKKDKKQIESLQQRIKDLIKTLSTGEEGTPVVSATPITEPTVPREEPKK